MGLLPALTRAQIDSELRPLWDDCERLAPTFRELWATQANSPIVFRHIWGGLLEMKKASPVAARQFELAIVVVSSLNRCRFCVAHHVPLAEAAGTSAAQLATLRGLSLGPLPEDYAFPQRAGFDAGDSLVIDLAYFLVWAGTWANLNDVHPRVVQTLRRRLWARLAERCSPQQIEELVWRITQCVAFNWHNEFFELD
ncbi:MAG TPA: carboxymuconolactone decarboxylase family protein [Methylomirabilota bacterium]|jgi:AhpD family alkylhydroperoxidase|nr:carboxymuconolactone decarboxylase family protein [Methylomirabilota bacterium]